MNGALASDLAVPWALDQDSRPTPPDAAERGRAYRCPDPTCAAELILKSGTVVRRHFAHPPGFSCTEESRLHSAAKHQAAWDVVWWRHHSGIRPRVVFPACRACGACHTLRLPTKVTGARLEVDLGGARVDVALVNAAGDVIAAVEIRVTHEVERSKADLLRRMALPWVELRADELLGQPGTWVAVQHAMDPGLCRFELPVCPRCHERLSPGWSRCIACEVRAGRSHRGR